MSANGRPRPDSERTNEDAPEFEKLAAAIESGRVQCTRLEDGTGVLLDVECLGVLQLNETGLFLVESIRDGVDGADGLASRLSEEFGIRPERAAGDVAQFLVALEGLLLT